MMYEGCLSAHIFARNNKKVEILVTDSLSCPMPQMLSARQELAGDTKGFELFCIMGVEEQLEEIALTVIETVRTAFDVHMESAEAYSMFRADLEKNGGRLELLQCMYLDNLFSDGCLHYPVYFQMVCRDSGLGILSFYRQ